MRRIIIKEARSGMVAARVIGYPGKPGTPLAAAGETLTVELLASLHEAGVYDLWVTDPHLEFLDGLSATQSTSAERRLAEGLQQSFWRWSAAGGPTMRTILRRYDAVIPELVQSLVRGASVVPCFPALTEDESLLAHSCDVCVGSSRVDLQACKLEYSIVSPK